MPLAHNKNGSHDMVYKLEIFSDETNTLKRSRAFTFWHKGQNAFYTSIVGRKNK